MLYHQLDPNKWKEIASQVLGNDFFSGFADFSHQGPRYNIYKNASEIIVLIELPYLLDLSQINLTVKEQELQLKGKIELGFNHMEVYRSQIFSGDFETVIPLPYAVNTKKVNAHYQKGILKVQLFPKLKNRSQNVNIQGL